MRNAAAAAGAAEFWELGPGGVLAGLARRTDKTTITKLLRVSWEAVAKIVIDVVAGHPRQAGSRPSTSAFFLDAAGALGNADANREGVFRLKMGRERDNESRTETGGAKLAGLNANANAIKRASKFLTIFMVYTSHIVPAEGRRVKARMNRMCKPSLPVG